MSYGCCGLTLRPVSTIFGLEGKGYGKNELLFHSWCSGRAWKSDRDSGCVYWFSEVFV